MTNSFNVSEYKFTAVSYGSGGLPATATKEYANGINGQLLDVQWLGNKFIGSLSLKLSGTDITVWQNNAPSGAAWQSVTPGRFRQLSTGSVAGAFLDTFYLNDILYLQMDIGSNTSANVSGTGYQVNVRYR